MACFSLPVRCLSCVSCSWATLAAKSASCSSYASTTALSHITSHNAAGHILTSSFPPATVMLCERPGRQVPEQLVPPSQSS